MKNVNYIFRFSRTYTYTREHSSQEDRRELAGPFSAFPINGLRFADFRSISRQILIERYDLPSSPLTAGYVSWINFQSKATKMGFFNIRVCGSVCAARKIDFSARRSKLRRFCSWGVFFFRVFPMGSRRRSFRLRLDVLLILCFNPVNNIIIVHLKFSEFKNVMYIYEIWYWVKMYWGVFLGVFSMGSRWGSCVLQLDVLLILCFNAVDKNSAFEIFRILKCVLCLWNLILGENVLMKIWYLCEIM